MISNKNMPAFFAEISNTTLFNNPRVPNLFCLDFALITKFSDSLFTNPKDLGSVCDGFWSGIKFHGRNLIPLLKEQQDQNQRTSKIQKSALVEQQKIGDEKETTSEC